MAPVRVLHVVTFMGRGGLETMLMNYYRRMDRTKVQFDFLTHRQERADYDDEIEALGGRIYRLPRLNPFSPGYRRRLDMFFGSHPEYRIVHVHQDCLSGIALKAAKKHGIPVRIAHSHSSSQVKDLKYPIKRLYMPMIPRYATHLFACSTVAGDWMFLGAPYRVLRNAIDTRAFAYDSAAAGKSKEKLGLENSFVIGHVGQFRTEKNQAFLLEIFPHIRKRCPEARLILAGSGPHLEACREKAARMGLGDTVWFLGNRGDIPALMQAMDVFVLPSVYEGFPVTMIEAQAAGLPCLISDGVPLECRLTEHVRQVSLALPPEAWAEEILACRNLPRQNTASVMQEAGLDISQNARWLEEFYLHESE